jgi:hypothetical protein
MSEFSTLLPQAIEGLVHKAAEMAVGRQQEVLKKLAVELEATAQAVHQLRMESLETSKGIQANLKSIEKALERLLYRAGPCDGIQQVAGAIHELSERVANGSRQTRAGFEDLRALAKVYSDRLEAKIQPSDAATGAASNVASEKLIAYLATEYCLGYNPEEVVLKIGKHSASLAELFTEHRVTCGAFITAYNPEGTQQSAEANAQDHAALLQRVVEFGHSFIEGVGAGTTGEWPLERSVFAYGMDKASACAVGRQFHQDAIVWVGADAVPQLVLLR